MRPQSLPLEIRIDRLRIHARHGVLAQERMVGNDFEVSVVMQVEGYDGSDRLDSTVNYADVIALVEREMAVPSDLIEHVASRIASAVACGWPQVTGGRVTVAKLRPPVAAVPAQVAVTVPIRVTSRRSE